MRTLIHLPDDLADAQACLAALPRELPGHVRWQYAAIRSAEHLICQLSTAADRNQTSSVATARSPRESGSAFLLCADPIHLTLGRDQAYLEADAALVLNIAESEQLRASLNAHFLGDGIRFFQPTAPSALCRASTWNVAFPAPLDIQTATLSEALGNSAAAQAPRGNSARRLRALETEVQMLLHDHLVNQTRESRGARAVNSVWFWGEADAPTSTPTPTRSEFLDDATTLADCLTVNFCQIPVAEYASLAQQTLGQSSHQDQQVGLVFRQHLWWSRPLQGAKWRFWRAQDWRPVLEKLLANQVLVIQGP